VCNVTSGKEHLRTIVRLAVNTLELSRLRQWTTEKNIPLTGLQSCAMHYNTPQLAPGILHGWRCHISCRGRICMGPKYYRTPAVDRFATASWSSFDDATDTHRPGTISLLSLQTFTARRTWCTSILTRGICYQETYVYICPFIKQSIYWSVTKWLLCSTSAFSD